MRGTGRDKQGQIMLHLAGHAKGLVMFKNQISFFKDVKAFASHSEILAFRSSEIYFDIKPVKVIASHSPHTRPFTHAVLHCDHLHLGCHSPPPSS